MDCSWFCLRVLEERTFLYLHAAQSFGTWWRWGCGEKTDKELPNYVICQLEEFESRAFVLSVVIIPLIVLDSRWSGIHCKKIGMDLSVFFLSILSVTIIKCLKAAWILCELARHSERFHSCGVGFGSSRGLLPCIYFPSHESPVDLVDSFPKS